MYYAIEVILLLTVSEKLRLLLRRRDMTLGELADATGQSRQNLSNKMTRDNFSEKEIYQIAEVLGCSVEITFRMPDGTEI